MECVLILIHFLNALDKFLLKPFYALTCLNKLPSKNKLFIEAEHHTSAINAFLLHGNYLILFCFFKITKLYSRIVIE